MIKTVLTGIKPSAEFHLGNYVGAIRPSLKLAQQAAQSFLFIADAHALTTVHKGAQLSEYSYSAIAAWLACGLEPERSIVYRQSQVPEVFELYWLLSCATAKGLMNRAHAYKAVVAQAEQEGKAPDQQVSMALFSYPVLMAADILLFSATHVPVGEDQKQHVEYARDIAQKFNSFYGPVLTLPEPIIGTASLTGLDGRKMSKSYGNHIPLFLEDNKLHKLIKKIKTDSSPPEAPKDPAQCNVYHMYKAFASEEQATQLAQQYRQGIGWGAAKDLLFEQVRKYFKEKTACYNKLRSDIGFLNKVLDGGAQRAREHIAPLVARLRSQTGLKAR